MSDKPFYSRQNTLQVKSWLPSIGTLYDFSTPRGSESRLPALTPISLLLPPHSAQMAHAVNIRITFVLEQKTSLLDEKCQGEQRHGEYATPSIEQKGCK